MDILGIPDYQIVELIGDVDQRIRPTQLLWMQHEEDLEDLGEAAKHFGGADCQGDALLAPVNAFNTEQLEAALKAGGEIIEGYEFDYPRGDLVAPLETWTQIMAWRGDAKRGVGYAMWFSVAAVVCALSFARLKGVKITNRRKR
jgi:hypothetical protein